MENKKSNESAHKSTPVINWWRVIGIVLLVVLILGIFSNNDKHETTYSNSTPSMSETSTIKQEISKTWHVVTMFSGSNNDINTDKFKIKGTQWRISWSSSANQIFDGGWCLKKGCDFVIGVNNIDNKSSFEYISKQNITSSASDVSDFYSSGEYYLDVHGDRMNVWNIKVEDYY